MSAGTQAFAAFGVAGFAALVTTPIAIRLAEHTGFYDEPAGYKKHSRPTPYLGGTAVVTSLVLAVLLFADALGRSLPILGCAVALWILGTLDDKHNLGPWLRLGAEVAVATVIWASGDGWGLFGADWANLLLTVVWVVGLVNGLNLMDNLDGAAGTVAAVSAAGIGTLGLIQGDDALAAYGFAICGGLVGFLRFNLFARPARIFLGDGGSMPLGFLLAIGAINAADSGGFGDAAILSAALLSGLVILDTTLVTISRRRRAVPLLTGGRDHLTHRLLDRVGSPAGVALVLGGAQGLLCLTAVLVDGQGRDLLFTVSAMWCVAGLAAIGALELQDSQRLSASESTAE